MHRSRNSFSSTDTALTRPRPWLALLAVKIHSLLPSRWVLGSVRSLSSGCSPRPRPCQCQHGGRPGQYSPLTFSLERFCFLFYSSCSPFRLLFFSSLVRVISCLQTCFFSFSRPPSIPYQEICCYRLQTLRRRSGAELPFRTRHWVSLFTLFLIPAPLFRSDPRHPCHWLHLLEPNQRMVKNDRRIRGGLRILRKIRNSPGRPGFISTRPRRPHLLVLAHSYVADGHGPV